MPAACDGAASGTRQRRHITPSGHLDQNRRTTVQRGAGRPQRQRRQSRRPGRRITFLLVTAVVECHHSGRVRSHHRPGSHNVVRPPGAHQRVRLRGAGIPPDQRRATGLVGAQHRYLASVRVGRAWLCQAVVAIGPHHDQSQIGERSEHRAAGADYQSGGAAQRGEPAPVAHRRSQPGG